MNSVNYYHHTFLDGCDLILVRYAHNHLTGSLCSEEYQIVGFSFCAGAGAYGGALKSRCGVCLLNCLSFCINATNFVLSFPAFLIPLGPETYCQP